MTARIASDANPQHCRVHGELLQRGRTPIFYGLPVYTRAEEHARESLFPYARSRVAGGCMETSNAPQEAIVWFCAKCREAERNWVPSRDDDFEDPYAELT